MVVYDLDVLCLPVSPYEANPVLAIDSNAMLALAVRSQGFQMVAGNGRKILQARRSL